MDTKAKNEWMRVKLIHAPDVDTAKAALDAEHTAEAWYDYGFSLAKAPRQEEAIDAYSQGLSEFPFASLLYFGRGRRFMAGVDYELALADFTMALQLEPDVNMYWYYRAVTNNIHHRLPEAVYDFRQALRLAAPEEVYSMGDWLFVSYVELGDREGARKLLDELPDDRETPDMDFDYKRRVQMYKGLVKPEDLVDLEEIRKHVPDPNDDLTLDINTLLFGKYIYYVYLGDDEKAEAALKEVLATPYEGAFATSKARIAAKERGLKAD